jgi:hypothetical protein
MQGWRRDLDSSTGRMPILVTKRKLVIEPYFEITIPSFMLHLDEETKIGRKLSP